MRYCASAGECSAPTGTVLTGEAEDYPIELVLRPADLILSKVTHAGVGAFAISGNNGIETHDLTTAAMEVPVAGPVQALSTDSFTVDTVFNERLASGWRLRDVACTGLVGGEAPRFTPEGTITIPAAALQPPARDVHCTLENMLATDLSIYKQNESPTGGTVVRGQATTYTLRVGNNGPGTSVGAMVRDQPGAGLNCPAENSVACTGPAGACPGRAAKVADLLGSPGLELGTLAPGAELSLSFQCTVE